MEEDLPYREEEKDEYIITQDQHNPFKYNSKMYEALNSNHIKPTRKEDLEI